MKIITTHYYSEIAKKKAQLLTVNVRNNVVTKYDERVATIPAAIFLRTIFYAPLINLKFGMLAFGIWIA